jgi:hypothetical protein
MNHSQVRRKKTDGKGTLLSQSARNETNSFSLAEAAECAERGRFLFG